MDYIEKIEREQKEEIKNAIKNNELYDFIVSNYWRIESNVLNALLFEAIATLKESQNDELLENLKEYREF